VGFPPALLLVALFPVNVIEGVTPDSWIRRNAGVFILGVITSVAATWLLNATGTLNLFGP
jgi:hypothetical protein